MEKDFLQLVEKRHSVRNYRQDDVEPEKLDYILRSVRLAPSACNKQPWRFIIVQDSDTRKKICQKGLGGIVGNDWAVQAPVLIIVCAVSSIIPHTTGRLLKSIDYRLIDIGIAGEHLCLAAAEQGLGTCWIGWFKARAIKKILDIPAGTKVLALISLGYSADEERNERERLCKEEIFFYDSYGPGKHEHS